MNQPVELVLKEMILMSDRDTIAYSKVNKRLNGIYEANKDYIYNQKIKTKFPCILDSKDLYDTLSKVNPKIIDKLCKKIFMTTPKCKNINKYLNDFFSKFNTTNDSDKKARMLIEMLSNMYYCIKANPENVSKNLSAILLDKIQIWNDQTNRTCSNETIKIWNRFYQKTGSKLVVIWQNRLN